MTLHWKMREFGYSDSRNISFGVIVSMQYGPFHRLGNPRTQSLRTAIRQFKSRSIWGKTPFGGFEPTIQAYAGHLPAKTQGVEFYTDIKPSSVLHAEVRWYPSLDDRLTEVDHWTVKIDAQIVKSRYSCLSE